MRERQQRGRRVERDRQAVPLDDDGVISILDVVAEVKGGHVQLRGRRRGEGGTPFSARGGAATQRKEYPGGKTPTERSQWLRECIGHDFG